MTDELREVARAAIQATRKPNEVPIFQRDHVDAVIGVIRPLIEKRDAEIVDLRADLKALTQEHVKFHSIKSGAWTFGVYTTPTSARMIQEAIDNAKKKIEEPS